MARAPAACTMARLALMPSIASILKPPQSAHSEPEMPSLARSVATLYASTPWWNERMPYPNSLAMSTIWAISSAR
jgi:hypothetical protein